MSVRFDAADSAPESVIVPANATIALTCDFGRPLLTDDRTEEYAEPVREAHVFGVGARIKAAAARLRGAR